MATPASVSIFETRCSIELTPIGDEEEEEGRDEEEDAGTVAKLSNSLSIKPSEQEKEFPFLLTLTACIFDGKLKQPSPQPKQMGQKLKISGNGEILPSDTLNHIRSSDQPIADQVSQITSQAVGIEPRKES